MKKVLLPTCIPQTSFLSTNKKKTDKNGRVHPMETIPLIDRWAFAVLVSYID